MTTPQVTPQVSEEVVVEASRQELQATLGLADREHFRVATLVPALASGLVEVTIPDKPTSRLQRYRLTAAANAWKATGGIWS